MHDSSSVGEYSKPTHVAHTALANEGTDGVMNEAETEFENHPLFRSLPTSSYAQAAYNEHGDETLRRFSH
jgi:hypothetical protein